MGPGVHGAAVQFNIQHPPFFFAMPTTATHDKQSGHTLGAWPLC